MPRAAVRIAMRLLARPNPALSSVFGLGLVMDLVEADWSDEPLRQRNIHPTPASAYLRDSARAARLGSPEP